MAVPLKFLTFLTFLSLDYIIDPGETTREYIRDQNEEMKKFLKEELHKMFAEQQSKVTGQLETLQADHQELSQSIYNLTTALFPPPLTEVEEVQAESGTIEFTAGTNPHLRTKIWMFQSKGGDSSRTMRFVLEENGLGEEARLSLWDSNIGDQTMWTGSQGDWQAERGKAGSVILVTLRISPGAAERPSFKLKFNTTSTRSDLVYSSEVVLGEGRQEVSFPPNNANNYPPKSFFVAVVAPPRGGSLQLTLNFLDLPGTPPDHCDNEFSVWFLQENSAGFPFTRLPFSAHRRCGRVGAISEHLGNSPVAILKFVTDNGPVGRGFRVQVN